MNHARRLRQRAVVKFTDLTEFIAELTHDAELVVRRIVRLTQAARAAQGGAFYHLLVHAGAVIEGQLVCLTAYAGQHWAGGWRRRGRRASAADEPAAGSATRVSRRARRAARRVRGAAAMRRVRRAARLERPAQGPRRPPRERHALSGGDK